MFITQREADYLISLPKTRVDEQEYTIPLSGEVIKIPIRSIDKREQFIFDINRGRLRLSKCTYQSRNRITIILVRLDVDGPPHTNPFVENVPLDYLQPYNGIKFKRHIYIIM